MKPILYCVVVLFLFASINAGQINSAEVTPESAQTETSGSMFNVGVGTVNITPAEEVTLAGSPSPKKTTSVETPLFVKAMVISAGGEKLAIVTLDHLKYPTELAVKARKQIETTTGIPARNIIISASHTHFAPLWPYYKDRLITSIRKAVALAAHDLEPCRLGTSRGTVEGLNQNRRVLKEGRGWNTWLLKPAERNQYAAAGPADPEVAVLAAVGKEGRYKAILYNYACHPTSTPGAMISADYPGHVQRCVAERLGYKVPTLFLLGACGDVNPKKRNASFMGQKIAGEILNRLKDMRLITTAALYIESREKQVPCRENPKFAEREILLKWPAQLNHYRKAFEAKQRLEKPTYQFHFTGIRIGDHFAIITNPVELFSKIGMNIKNGSPFKNTMVATQTNGARGYVPTKRAFEEGGYETWYGEHSYVTIQAGAILKKESLDILKRLENKE